ncbi:ABC transporter ATP-binding protein [Paenibacillus arenosi]|uniref:ABC transporter ATP-binding protein n=1 Tax=Paenibacillus arenosi TaxID=2774142 RepID=A0ABR9AWQ5_9BACL|nr:ABC transporter ATP-binding protein [Paenibacillus arenosi]MBD8498540.1 ABC transporter ATP-binding protein [Paenibacillus arenosi]
MDNNSTFRQLITRMMKYWKMYVVLLITTIIGIVSDLSIAWILSVAINFAVDINNANWTFFIYAGLGLLLIIGINSYLDTYVKAKVSLNVRNDLRMELSHHILRLPQSYYDKHHTGDILARFTNDINSVGEACGTTIMGLIKNPLLSLAAFIYLLTIHWQLALICITLGSLMLVSGKVFGKLMRNTSDRLQHKVGSSVQFLQDICNSSMVIKTFGLEKKLFEKYREKSNEIVSLERSQGIIFGATASSSFIIGNLTFLLSVFMGSYLIATGSVGIGEMIAFVQLMNYLVTPFMGLPALWAGMQQALGGAQRVFDVLSEPTEKAQVPSEGRSPSSFKYLRCSNISFSYPEVKERNILNEVTFTAHSGQLIAVVGASGGGKSTLFKLLLGFYQPTKGNIQINDVDINEMSLRELRDYFALVPQETQLFTGTIRENIAYGNNSATDDDIIAAAKQANAYEFIIQLSEGFDTQIGERGSRLSGGQRQRISIARAIIRNAPILLLDEATAALDNESEWLVQDAIAKLMSDKTTIVIAHRLSTIQNADQILVMESGCIVERGNHEELLALQGRYYSLYEKQLKNELPVEYERTVL